MIARARLRAGRLAGPLVAGALIALASGAGARAEAGVAGVDAAELKVACLARSDFNAGKCIGFTAAIAHMMAFGERIGSLRACLPEDYSRDQVKDIVLQYLNENAHTGDFAAHAVVASALAQAFPCDADRPARGSGAWR